MNFQLEKNHRLKSGLYRTNNSNVTKTSLMDKNVCKLCEPTEHLEFYCPKGKLVQFNQPIHHFNKRILSLNHDYINRVSQCEDSEITPTTPDSLINSLSPRSGFNSPCESRGEPEMINKAFLKNIEDLLFNQSKQAKQQSEKSSNRIGKLNKDSKYDGIFQKLQQFRRASPRLSVDNENNVLVSIESGLNDSYVCIGENDYQNDIVQRQVDNSCNSSVSSEGSPTLLPF
eukprot:UN06932